MSKPPAQYYSRVTYVIGPTYSTINQGISGTPGKVVDSIAPFID